MPKESSLPSGHRQGSVPALQCSFHWEKNLEKHVKLSLCYDPHFSLMSGEACLDETVKIQPLAVFLLRNPQVCLSSELCLQKPLA